MYFKLGIMAKKLAKKVLLPGLSEVDFREQRNRLGLSVERVSELVGYSVEQIVFLESDVPKNPSYNMVKNLNNFYQTYTEV